MSPYTSHCLWELASEKSPPSDVYRMPRLHARGVTRKTMIVALARKLLIVLWRLATTGEVPEGLAIRAAA